MAGDISAASLPNGWIKLKVSQLIANGWLEIGDGYRAKNSEMAEIGLPFVRAGDVNGRVNTTGVDLLGESSLTYVGNKRSQPGDSVITTKGTIGRMAFVRPNDPAFIYSPQLCFWRPLNSRKIDPSWLYYGLQSEEMRHQMSWSAAQTDMAPYISLSDQRSVFEITLPPIEDQIAISSVLQSLDTKIELNRQMAATLEDMARALFKSWFVDFDPVHAKAKGRDTGLPADVAALFPVSFDDQGLPKGWTWKRADEIAQSVRSTADPKAMPPETPYVGLEHLPRKSLGTGNHGYASEVESGKLNFKAGDLLFGKLRPYFHKVSVMPFEGIASSDIFIFRAKSEKYRALMYFGFSEERFVSSATGASTGTRMPRADWSYMSEQQFASDDGRILEAFNEIALSHVTQIGEQLSECQKLEQIRDALLPKLLSGELRVDHAVDSIVAA